MLEALKMIHSNTYKQDEYYLGETGQMTEAGQDIIEHIVVLAGAHKLTISEISLDWTEHQKSNSGSGITKVILAPKINISFDTSDTSVNIAKEE
jgi:hypothetical protein